jgi:hypothetical protein
MVKVLEHGYTHTERELERQLACLRDLMEEMTEVLKDIRLLIAHPLNLKRRRALHRRE